MMIFLNILPDISPDIATITRSTSHTDGILLFILLFRLSTNTQAEE